MNSNEQLQNTFKIYLAKRTLFGHPERCPEAAGLGQVRSESEALQKRADAAEARRALSLSPVYGFPLLFERV